MNNENGLTPSQLAERNATLVTEIEKCRELSGCQAGVDLQDWVKQLAAENLALKAGVTYFAYSPEYGFDYFKDKQSAIDTAQAEIDAYREDADDGRSEDVQRVSWGVVIQQAQGFDAQGKHTSHNQHTYQTCDYRLVDLVSTPATDRIVAGIKADAANQMCVAFVKHKELAGLSDDDVVTVREATDAVLHCAEVISEGADK